MKIEIREDDGEVLCLLDPEDFVLVAWRKDEDGKVKAGVHQSDRGNTEHMELSVRLLARAMKNSGSPLFTMIGQVAETAMDQVIEQIKRDAAESMP